MNDKDIILNKIKEYCKNNKCFIHDNSSGFFIQVYFYELRHSLCKDYEYNSFNIRVTQYFASNLYFKNIKNFLSESEMPFENLDLSNIVIKKNNIDTLLGGIPLEFM